MTTATAVRERPILFSGPMVRAILEGRKTVTRRVIPYQPMSLGEPKWWDPFESWRPPSEQAYQDEAIKRCRFGVSGDRLWVRETWRPISVSMGEWVGVQYRADETTQYRPYVEGVDLKLARTSWRPSIHMPRWASRITLEVTEVRVERLQEISEEDAVAEGYLPKALGIVATWARTGFSVGWDSHNAKRGFGWDVNPWVWVIRFFRPKEDQADD